MKIEPVQARPTPIDPRPEPLPQERPPVVNAVKLINSTELSGNGSRRLVFAFDPRSNQAVIQIVDDATQEVLLQIPPMQVLSWARELQKMQEAREARETAEPEEPEEDGSLL